MQQQRGHAFVVVSLSEDLVPVLVLVCSGLRFQRFFQCLLSTASVDYSETPYSDNISGLGDIRLSEDVEEKLLSLMTA